MHRVDVAVIGGGLLGTLAMQRLADRGLESAWFDVADSTRGSNVPVALVHPFIGRSFAPTPELLSAWQLARQWLETLPAAARVHRAPLHRVLRDNATGHRLRRSFERHRERLHKYVEWELGLVKGVESLTYRPTYAYDLPAALQALRASLLERGALAYCGGVVSSLHPRGERWMLEHAEGDLEASHVIVAAGRGSVPLLAPWTALPRLQLFEGSLQVGSAPPLDAFIVDGGHISSTQTHVAWGSSYRELGAPDNRDPQAQLEVISQAMAGWADLPENQRWTGVRLTAAAERKPWVDSPRSGLHVCTALGSKGTLWGPSLMRSLVDTLM